MPESLIPIKIFVFLRVWYGFLVPSLLFLPCTSDLGLRVGGGGKGSNSVTGRQNDGRDTCEYSSLLRIPLLSQHAVFLSSLNSFHLVLPLCSFIVN